MTPWPTLKNKNSCRNPFERVMLALLLWAATLGKTFVTSGKGICKVQIAFRNIFSVSLCVCLSVCLAGWLAGFKVLL